MYGPTDIRYLQVKQEYEEYRNARGDRLSLLNVPPLPTPPPDVPVAGPPPSQQQYQQAHVPHPAEHAAFHASRRNPARRYGQLDPISEREADQDINVAVM